MDGVNACHWFVPRRKVPCRTIRSQEGAFGNNAVVPVLLQSPRHLLEIIRWPRLAGANPLRGKLDAKWQELPSDAHQTELNFPMPPTIIPKSMTVANPQLNAQSKQTTVKSPAELRSARALEIKAAIEHATQCIVAHMRKQILTRQNGL